MDIYSDGLGFLVLVYAERPEVSTNVPQESCDVWRAARASEPLRSSGQVGIAGCELVDVGELLSVGCHTGHDRVVEAELHDIRIFSIQVQLATRVRKVL